MVVTHNSERDVAACIESLRAAGAARVIVVDSASGDGTLDIARLAGAEVIALDDNRGFGAAANRGVAASTSDFVAISNADLVVDAGVIDACVEAMESHPSAAVVGPRIDRPDGTRYPSARTFPRLGTALGHGLLAFIAPSNRYSRRYRRDDWDPTETVAVDWVSGTFLLARRRALSGVGGFDESYFMYVEDVDLCWRLRAAGWDTLLAPMARVVHLIGGSSQGRPLAMIVEHHRSLWRFACRTTQGPQRLLLPVVAVGLAARVVVAWVEHLVRRRPHADR